MIKILSRTSLLLLFFSSAFAQEMQDTKAFRPATEAEFIGYWRVMLIPDDKLKLKIRNKDTEFSGPCQILIHRPGGYWFNISVESTAGDEKSRRQCPTVSHPQAEIALMLNPAPLHMWKRVTPDLFSVEDTENHSKRYWAVDYTMKDASAPDYFDFKKGDLLMNMAVPTGDGRVVIAWRMVLRPLPEVAPPSDSNQGPP